MFGQHCLGHHWWRKSLALAPPCLLLQVYRAALKLVPHHVFTFSKVCALRVGWAARAMCSRVSGMRDGCVCRVFTFSKVRTSRVGWAACVLRSRSCKLLALVRWGWASTVRGGALTAGPALPLACLEGRTAHHACAACTPCSLSPSCTQLWLLAANLEVRCKRLDAARRILGMGVGMAPKNKTFKAYIELEYTLGQVDR